MHNNCYKISAFVQRFSDSFIVLHYSGNKGFRFLIIFFPQNFDYFRKSMQNTYRLSQKAKQLEDDSIARVVLGLSQEGVNNIFFTLSPLIISPLLLLSYRVKKKSCRFENIKIFLSLKSSHTREGRHTTPFMSDHKCMTSIFTIISSDHTFFSSDIVFMLFLST